jgi:hypothetical protein
MNTTPLQHYILMVEQWVAKVRTDQIWDHLSELRQPAEAIAQLAEDIVVWLDFKGYPDDAHYFLEQIGECHASMSRIYMWIEMYPHLQPEKNRPCREAMEAVIKYSYGDIQKTQWLDKKLPQEVWDGFDSR